MPYRDIRGQRLYYEERIGNGEKVPTLIFIHGAGGNERLWKGQLENIRGYNLMAIDLPGHGRSKGLASDTIEAYRESVRNFTESLNIEKYVIVGHSMGGGIALELALAYPEAIQGLIIIASGARLRVHPSITDTLSKGEHPLEIITSSYSSKTNQEVLQKAIEEMKTIPTETYLSDFTACNKLDVMGRIHTISIPTLIVCGEEDRMTPPKYSEFLNKEILNSTLIKIPNAGHMAMLEQATLVNTAITEFLVQNNLSNQ